MHSNCLKTGIIPFFFMKSLSEYRPGIRKFTDTKFFN
jgi:hypothetical protein